MSKEKYIGEAALKDKPGKKLNLMIRDRSITTPKLADGSITNEKLAENSITKDKLKDNTIGVEKLDSELRQAINAATGLPEDLVETIQNVDDTLEDHQRQLDDKQSQIDDKQQQITANDEDISLLQNRSTQMEETLKSIAATSGASQATAVTYNNEKSGLIAINAQAAIDEVNSKVSDLSNSYGHTEKVSQIALVNNPAREMGQDISSGAFKGYKVDISSKYSDGFRTVIFRGSSFGEDYNVVRGIILDNNNEVESFCPNKELGSDWEELELTENSRYLWCSYPIDASVGTLWTPEYVMTKKALPIIETENNRQRIEELSESQKVKDEIANYSDLLLGKFYVTANVGSKYVQSENANMGCYIASCKEGDIFVVIGSGAVNGRLWAFADVNDIILLNSQPSLDGHSGVTIKAPKGAVKIIVNLYSSSGIDDIPIRVFKLIKCKTFFDGNTLWNAMHTNKRDITFNRHFLEEGLFYVTILGQSIISEKNTSFARTLIPCKEGDKFAIYGIGGVNGRLWAFADENGIVISMASSALDAKDGVEIEAPIGAKYLICNNNGAKLSNGNFKVIYKSASSDILLYKYAAYWNGDNGDQRIKKASVETFSVKVNGKKNIEDNQLSILHSKATYEAPTEYSHTCQIIMPDTDKPAKLVISCPGGGYYATSWYEVWNHGPILTSLGYAVLCITGYSPQYFADKGVSTNGAPCGNWMATEEIRKAYDYVVNKYMIDENGVIFLGNSQGGMVAENAAELCGIPTLCTILDVPAISMQYAQMYLSHRLPAINALYGFNGTFDKNKCIGCDPFTRGVDVDVEMNTSETLPTIDDINSIVSKKFRANNSPVLIMSGADDNTISSDVHKVYAKMLMNAGCDCKFIKYEGVGHGCLYLTDMVGKINGYDVTAGEVEMLNFMQKSGGYEWNLD